ncbi:MAG: hypothetical protein ACI32N_06910 [Bulleidia sp.]
MAANPIAVVIRAITALVAAFLYLWNTIEKFRNLWIGLLESIRTTVSQTVEGISSFLSNAWQTISTTAHTVWNTMKNVVSTVVNATDTAATSAFTNMLSGISCMIANGKG